MTRMRGKVAQFLPQDSCPACGQGFAKGRGLEIHLSKSYQCDVYAEELRELRSRRLQEADEGNELDGKMDVDEVGDADELDVQMEHGDEANARVDPLDLLPSPEFAIRLDDLNRGQSPSPSPTRVEEYETAGKSYGPGSSFFETLESRDSSEMRQARDANPYWPFEDEKEWELGLWLIETGLSQKAITNFLKLNYVKDRPPAYKSAIRLMQNIERLPSPPRWKTVTITFPGYSTTEPIVLYYRNASECAQMLFSNPRFHGHLDFKPSRVFIGENRQYTEMSTGDRWWSLQEKLDEGGHQGATIGSIMVGTDKAQLVKVAGDLQAYPVYLSLGNIHRHVRSKYSAHAWVLVGYLPLPVWDKVDRPIVSILERRLYHHCMSVILEPLIESTLNPQMWSDPSGSQRLVVPVLMSMPVDHPEQLLIACVRASASPISKATTAQFGDPKASPLRRGADTMKILNRLAQQCDPNDLLAFDAQCKRYNLTAVVNPFWACWWGADPSEFLTTDALHLHHKFFLDHVLTWIKNMVDSTKELDFRHQIQPFRVGTRHFSNGITKLQKCTGREQRDLERIVVVASRGISGVSKKASAALRAINDVIYICRYDSHDDGTISLLEDALQRFHNNKDALIKDGGRLQDHFNLPKLEKMHHTAYGIRQLGVVGPLSTEATEHEHQDACGRPFRASNHVRIWGQMARWRDRREKVRIAPDYVLWKKLQRLQMHNLVEEEGQNVNDTPSDCDSEDSNASVADLVDDLLESMAYRLPTKNFFAIGPHHDKRQYLFGDVAIHLKPQKPRPYHLPLEDVIRNHHASRFQTAFYAFETGTRRKPPVNYRLPFDYVTVWPGLRLQRRAVHDHEMVVEPTTVKAMPLSLERPYGQCDIVLICHEDTETVGLKGYDAVQLRLIFEPRYQKVQATEPLLYVEYFSKCGEDTALNVFKFRRSRDSKNRRRTAILPLSALTKSIQFVPWFGEDAEAPRDLDCYNVLEKWDEFLLNPFLDDFSYQTVY